jgi:hypothetical protein
MVRIALMAVLLPACAASMLAGASTVTAAALGTSAMQRKAGGCYASCAAGTACNPNNGMCERLPCDGLCAADEHCESSVLKSWCAPGAPSDVLSKAPGTQRTIPVLPPWVPPSSGPPQIVPAAEQWVPPGK